MRRPLSQARQAATNWRLENTQHQGGVVLVWEGEAYGWKNALRNPDCERPGACAVDAEDHVYVAEGGDDINGAKCWVVVNKA